MNVSARLLPRMHDRRLFVGASLGVLAIMFAGFARSYFLRPLFFHDPLPLLLHVHGLVMFAWFALFFVQTCLIETHRIALHRKLGTFGVFLAATMLVLSQYVAFHAAARDVRAHNDAAAFDLAILGYWLASQAPPAMRTCHHLHGGMGMDITYPMNRYFSSIKDLTRVLGGPTHRLDLVGA